VDSFEFDVAAAGLVEQRDSVAEHHRGDAGEDFVQVAGLEELAGEVGA
jgi:hypothetical protein